MSYIGNIIIHMDFLEIIDIWGRFHPMLHFELTSQGRITVNVAATCAFNSIVRICWLRDLQWKSGCQLSKLTFIKHPLSSTFIHFPKPRCPDISALPAASLWVSSFCWVHWWRLRGLKRQQPKWERDGAISTHREREGDSTTVWYCKLLLVVDIWWDVIIYK